ncbi:MAG: TRAP transporter substrate-binding protein [Rhodocyclaceae bacterium]
MSRRSWISALFVAGTLTVPAQAQTVLTMSSWVPPSHIITAKMMLPWAQDVEKATQGRVKFRLLPKAVASPPQSFDAVRDGLADVSFTVHGYTPGRFVLTKAAEFAFLGDSAEATSVAYQRIFEKHLAKADEHKGVIALAVFTHGPGHIYNTKRPINALADLAGMKVRVGGGVVNDITKALGATPLLKPSTEAYELLNSGVADGLFFPHETVASFKLTGVVKYATVVPGGLYNTSFVFMMNPAKFAAISKADQQAILKLSGEHFARRAGKAWDEADAAGLEAIRKAGIHVQTASPALLGQIKAKTDAVEHAWYEAAKAKGVDGAALMAELRAEIRKAGGR